MCTQAFDARSLRDLLEGPGVFPYVIPKFFLMDTHVTLHGDTLEHPVPPKTSPGPSEATLGSSGHISEGLGRFTPVIVVHNKIRGF